MRCLEASASAAASRALSGSAETLSERREDAKTETESRIVGVGQSIVLDRDVELGHEAEIYERELDVQSRGLRRE